MKAMRLRLAFALPVACAAWAQPGPVALGPVHSAGDHFRVSLLSETFPVTINRMTAWKAHVETPDASPALDLKIGVAISATGLARLAPTAPRVTAALSGGDYVIEGVKFDMAGHWRVELRIDSGAIADRATFDIDVK